MDATRGDERGGLCSFVCTVLDFLPCADGQTRESRFLEPRGPVTMIFWDEDTIAGRGEWPPPNGGAGPQVRPTGLKVRLW